MGLCISKQAVYTGKLTDLADESAARLGDPTQPAPPKPPPVRTPRLAGMDDSAIEAMADQLLANRTFRTVDEVRRYASGMTASPGRTPTPANLMSPGLERAVQRRIKALAPPPIAE